MILLNTKNFTQSFDSACCGPRTIAILADYYGIPASARSLINRCQCTTKTGTSTEDMNRVLKELGLKRKRIRKRNFRRDVVSSIRRGCPVAVLFATSDDECHYAAIVGYTERHYVFEDPYYGSKFLRGSGEFEVLAKYHYYWCYSIEKEKQ